MKKNLLILVFISIGLFSFSQSVTTFNASSVQEQSAILHGEFTSGSGYYTQAKFEVSEAPSVNGIYASSDFFNASPTFSNVIMTTADITVGSLDASKTYYYRFIAYHVNSGSMIYGNEVQFTTTGSLPETVTGSISNVTATSASCIANMIVGDGGLDITGYGICWNTIGNPEITDNNDGVVGNYPTNFLIFDNAMTSLLPNTHYYVRSYASNANGISYNSDVIEFTTLDVPAITTTIPSSITKISADVGGDVTNDFGSSVTERGICWGLITGVTIADTKIIAGSTGTGSFSASMSSLSAGTQYYYNSYAINSIGTGYGIEKNFITNTIDPTCTNATNITESSFNANWGAVTGAQGYYLDVSTVSNFGSFVPGYENLDVTNVTTYNVTGLSSETVYFYRVRAYHDGGDDGVDFTSGSSANKNTTTLDSEPDVQASEIEWANNGGDILLEWIDGNGEGNMLIMKASSNVTNPVDGVEYTANAAFGSGTQIGAGTYVMYRSVHFDGTASVLITNVVNGVDYYFKVLEYSGQGITTNYNLEDNTDGFGIGNIGSTTLPVELIYFGAEKTSNSVTLNWITASEINNDYFILEHSKDGKNFEEIATVDGSGNSNLTLDYSYEDKRELEGINYYRLRQVDFDGKETTFSIVSVNCGINDKLEGNVYVDNTILNVELNSESYDATMIRLIDINGRNMQFVISKTQGPNTVKFDMSDLARGIYFVRIERGEEIISKKIVY